MSDWTNLARQGQIYSIANVSAKSVIAVTTAMTGVILYNPVGSGKQYAILDAGFAWTTVPGALHNLGIAVGPSSAAPTSLTAIGSGVKSLNGLGNAGASIAGGYDAATFAVAPVAARWFGGAAWVTGAGVGPYFMVDKVDGAICLSPGTFACLTAVTTTAVGIGHMTWAEFDA